MQKFIGLIFLACFIKLIVACNHPRKDFSDVPVSNDSTELVAKVDSGHNIRQDGLDYDPLNTGTYNQLPDIITEWLNQHYVGWSLPTIAEDYLEKTKRTAPGPFYLEADLNQDQLADYAVLYQYRDSATVAVYLVQKTGKLQEFILERKPLENTAQEDRSRYYLIKPETGIEVYNTQTDKNVILPAQAFGVVGKGNNIRYYFFSNNAFSVINSRQDRL
jgi:hypothetical protein